MFTLEVILIISGATLWLLWGVFQLLFSIPAGNYTLTDKFFDLYGRRMNWLGKVIFSPIAFLIGGPFIILWAIYIICEFLGKVFIKKEFRK